ncbi:phage portal protein [Paraburkholderia youngii]|uniref:phage portal protein n=1 Tax=Paraburkholderia youngii TaxID=2782701 RepID=UPI003D21E12A
MRILGLQITRAAPRTAIAQNVSPIGAGGGWWPIIIREPYSGAWQQNRELAPETVLAYYAVYACVTLISADIGKLGMRLMQSDSSGIWSETQNAAYSPVLRKPNSYQNRIQFIENWIMSKLTRGNTYALKERDARGVVTALHVLNPWRVLPLVAKDGSVYYQLNTDNLAGIEDGVTVPASEIIHDRMNCLFHPLVGTSPLFACSLAARQGLAIQSSSAMFFENGAQPSGVLVAPGAISDETAKRLKEKWEENYGGANRGRLAVLGDGLKYESITMNAVDAQLIDQLKMTAEVVCSVFHVPGYLIETGPNPTYNNIEALSQAYYSQCLQSLIESLELCMDEGLGLSAQLRTECDLDALLRMDTATMMKTLTDGVGGGIVAPNEARRKLNMKPVKGGESPYLQQQNYSLAALNERDSDKPFAKPATLPPPTPPAAPAADGGATDDQPDDQTAPQKVYARLMARLNGSADDHG